MTELDEFNVKQVLAIVEVKLVTDPNSAEFEFYIKLKEELIIKLRKHNGRI